VIAGPRNQSTQGASDYVANPFVLSATVLLPLSAVSAPSPAPSER